MTDLVVTGDLEVQGTTGMNNMATLRSDGFVSGFVRVGALACTGLTSLQASASVGGSLAVGGPLLVDDLIRTSASKGIVCGGELHVAQPATLQDTLSCLGGLEVAGDATLETLVSGGGDTPTVTAQLASPNLSAFLATGRTLSGQIQFRGTASPARVVPGDTVTVTFGTPLSSTPRPFLQRARQLGAISWEGCDWEVAVFGNGGFVMAATGTSGDFNGVTMAVNYLIVGGGAP